VRAKTAHVLPQENTGVRPRVLPVENRARLSDVGTRMKVFLIVLALAALPLLLAACGGGGGGY